MSVETAILDALNGHLNDLVFSPAIPIAWPNKPLTPPAGNAPWLRPTLLRGGPSTLALPNNSRNLYPGLYQVDAFDRLGNGEDDLTEIGAAIAAHFLRGTTLVSGDYTIRIVEPPALLPIQREDAYIMLPVRITWQTYALNE